MATHIPLHITIAYIYPVHDSIHTGVNVLYVSKGIILYRSMLANLSSDALTLFDLHSDTVGFHRRS